MADPQLLEAYASSFTAAWISRNHGPPPAPALAQGQSRTLRFILQIELAFLDPHWTTASVTGNNGSIVLDTLYVLDQNNVPYP
jgi:hypothetical protein